MRLTDCLRSLFWGWLVCCLLISGAAAEPAVWTGLAKSFTKTAGANPFDPANQDRITDNVALGRASTKGLFNAITESAYLYSNSSPAGTLWATDLNNPGETIGASNWAALTFESWTDAYGGSSSVGQYIVGRDAVVHLVQDDIYLDLRFTGWGIGAGGGGRFTYLRAAVPEPGWAAVAGFGLLGLGLSRWRRRKPCRK